MGQHTDHTDLVKEFYEAQKEVFDTSDQAIYAYLDDTGRVCNANFATLLGYDSANEWSNLEIKDSFPNTFVAEKSQEALVNAYQDAMEKGIGSVIKVAWKKKSGSTVDTNVILVPVIFQGHTFALHFIS